MSPVVIELPSPRLSGGKCLEHCLVNRRSCRMFGEGPLTLAQTSQLLWAGQGITGLGGLRTAPSAGAVFPLYLYLIALRVQGLKPGVYTYDLDRCALALLKAGDMRAKLLKAACNQDEVESAAAGILIAANYARSKREFGEDGVKLAHMEAGHIAQNILLQATALSLGALGMGRIDVAAMNRALDLPATHSSLYLLLAGEK